MVYVEGVPGHPPTVGVTVMVDVMAAVVALVAVKLEIFPVPFAAIPMAVFELVQAKVPPAGVLVNAVAATVPLAQTTTFAGTVTVGTTGSVTVDVAVAVHPLKSVTVTV